MEESEKPPPAIAGKRRAQEPSKGGFTRIATRVRSNPTLGRLSTRNPSSVPLTTVSSISSSQASVTSTSTFKKFASSFLSGSQSSQAPPQSLATDRLQDSPGIKTQHLEPPFDVSNWVREPSDTAPKKIKGKRSWSALAQGANVNNALTKITGSRRLPRSASMSSFADNNVLTSHEDEDGFVHATIQPNISHPSPNTHPMSLRARHGHSTNLSLSSGFRPGTKKSPRTSTINRPSGHVSKKISLGPEESPKYRTLQEVDEMDDSMEIGDDSGYQSFSQIKKPVHEFEFTTSIPRSEGVISGLERGFESPKTRRAGIPKHKSSRSPPPAPLRSSRARSTSISMVSTDSGIDSDFDDDDIFRVRKDGSKRGDIPGSLTAKMRASISDNSPGFSTPTTRRHYRRKSVSSIDSRHATRLSFDTSFSPLYSSTPYKGGSGSISPYVDKPNSMDQLSTGFQNHAIRSPQSGPLSLSISASRKRDSTGDLISPGSAKSFNFSFELPERNKENIFPGRLGKSSDGQLDRMNLAHYTGKSDDEAMDTTPVNRLPINFVDNCDQQEDDPSHLTDGTTSASSSIVTSLCSHASSEASTIFSKSSHLMGRTSSDQFSLGDLPISYSGLTACSAPSSFSLHNGLPSQVTGIPMSSSAVEAYKNIKPLASAFSSKGLLTKKEVLESHGSSRVLNSSAFLDVPSLDGHVSIDLEKKEVPDTPVKKTIFGRKSSEMNMDKESPLGNNSHILDNVSTSPTLSSGGSERSVLANRSFLKGHDLSPTNSHRISNTASTMWKRNLFRRKSDQGVSDTSSPIAARFGHSPSNSNAESSSMTVESPSPSIKNTYAGEEGEPITPTRVGPQSTIPLLTTPSTSDSRGPSRHYSLSHASFPIAQFERSRAPPSLPVSNSLRVIPGSDFVRSRHSSITDDLSLNLGRVSFFERNFTLIRTLGKGEFSLAFEVKDKRREGVFAVKKMKERLGGFKDRLRKFEEVDILKDISGSIDRPQYIIELIDAWEEHGHLFIETELCSRGDLSTFLLQNPERLDEGRVWKIFVELCKGLEFIHRKNILHLDIKPANIFITKNGSLRIGDFGLATRWPRVDAAAIIRGVTERHSLDGAPPRSVTSDGLWKSPHAERTRAKSNGASPEDFEREGDRQYMALEILSNKYGREADIFSLGLTMLETALSLELPENGEEWRRLRSGEFCDVHNADVISPQLREHVFSMLHPTPESRPTIIDLVRGPQLRELWTMDLLPALEYEDPSFLDRAGIYPPQNEDESMEVDI